jgi:hypothetical protein
VPKEFIVVGVIVALGWLFDKFVAPESRSLSRTEWMVLAVGVFIAWGLGTIHDRLDRLQDRLAPDDDEDDADVRS